MWVFPQKGRQNRYFTWNHRNGVNSGSRCFIIVSGQYVKEYNSASRGTTVCSHLLELVEVPKDKEENKLILKIGESVSSSKTLRCKPEEV